MGDQPGMARIYSFPFRIYASDDLEKVEVRSPDTRHRFRVHTPFFVREGGPPASPEPPVSKWPDYRQSPDAIGPVKGTEITNVMINPLSGSEPFDAMRVDAWGPNAEEEGKEFADSLLEWIRIATHQAWIGTVEVHTDPNIKYVIPIDITGAALEPPMSYGLRTGLPPGTRILSDDLWKQAIAKAANEDQAPTHWSTYLDANLYRALGRTGSAVLALALAMEVARDTLFPRFGPTKEKRGLGEVLVGPFQESTDLEKHLTSDLEEIHPDGRNLEKEHPVLATDVHNLYVARHHVAHGGEPVYPVEDRGVTPVESDTLVEWTESVHKVLAWMDAL